jgi:Zn-dependent protease with chaperone function
VCINEGLLELLDAAELEGVLAHELSHVYRRDVLLCRKPLALASALAKIEAGADVRRRAGHTAAEASPAFGSLYIAAPLGGTGGLHQLVATHPPTAERIRRLEALAARRPRIGRGHHQRLVEVVGLGTDGAAAGSPRAGVG